MYYVCVSIQPAIQVLKTTRFGVLTGCNATCVSLLSGAKPYNGTELKGCGACFSGGCHCVDWPALTTTRQPQIDLSLNPTNPTPTPTDCSNEFADAVDEIGAGACYRGTTEQVTEFPKNYLFYSQGKNGVKQNYCDSDTYVQSLGPNDAVKLRAFLYTTQVRTCLLTPCGDFL